jgi:type IV pilus assembly protein PilX
MNRRIPRFSRDQRGISLLVVLVLLLIMTLLGLAILRGTMLEERMAGNMFERSLAFQAAESALREGELIAATAPTAPDAGCNATGVCSEPDITAVERWLDDAFAGWVDAPTLAGATPAPPPGAYFVEYMGLSPTWPGCDRQVPVAALCMAPSYRVTARSTAAGRATVILQSNFVVQ